MDPISQILRRIDSGDRHASDELLPLVYEQLRAMAAQKMRREPNDHTLQPTALVHEAFVRLVDAPEEQLWENQGHFFAAAAQAMRRILVENARRKNRDRHGGGRFRVEFSDPLAPSDDVRLLELDEALQRLTHEDPLAARVVELRFFSGLGHEKIAEVLGITIYAARQKWTYARAWLRDALKKT